MKMGLRQYILRGRLHFRAGRFFENHPQITEYRFVDRFPAAYYLGEPKVPPMLRNLS